VSRLLLAQPFTKRLAQMTNQDQKVIRDAVMSMHLDIVGSGTPRPGLRWHDLAGPNMFSISPNKDLRVILYHRGEDYVVLYTDHHDAAYRWADRRRLEVHPYTGAMQLVEIEERTEVVTTAEERPEVVAIVSEQTQEHVFGGYDPEYLLQLGVPERYVQTVRHATLSNAHQLLELLPEDVSVRLLGLLSGELVVPPEPLIGDPFQHPDALSLFMVAENEAELEAALSGDWQDWMVFLHPSQRRLAERTYTGPARVTGGAGTGKTVVALHRAARLARQGGRVLLTTYSRSLAHHLERRMNQLLPDVALRAKVRVSTVHNLAHELADQHRLPRGRALSSTDELRGALARAARETSSDLDLAFLTSEWRGVIEAQGVRSWEAYRDVRRTGRGTALGVRQRRAVWNVIQRFRSNLSAERQFTWRTVCDAIADGLAGQAPTFEHVIADEAQDLGPSELRFLLALTSDGPDRLLLSMDEGQRIYQTGFPLKNLGLNFQGRSARLTLNYRTSRQIRTFADQVLPSTLKDADDDTESRQTLSRFMGPEPEVFRAGSPELELQRAGEWLNARIAEGLDLSELAVFTRHDPESTARRLQELTGHATHVATKDDVAPPGRIVVSTMHHAKGLEFRAVAILGVNEDSLPSARRLAELQDPGDRETLIQQEGHLLYVATTRARDWLLLTYSGTPSRFLKLPEA
jgi:hypothetical protein